MSSCTVKFLVALLALPLAAAQAQFTDKGADARALPGVPQGFTATLYAQEPLVRQPCSMVFDARGRLYVGMGPQYRNPTPDTPSDSVVLVLDNDGDGRADTTKVFATGFNAVQGLAWHGGDLWVANSPDLTVVRDRDGDDEADEYVRIYTDLGNLEHGLHGLNWAPDGKLYMSKGNSKGLTKPNRIAPKPFRELWGVESPPDAPDCPPPESFRKGEYKHAYHDPADDWGREGGVLRCADGGKDLEIVSRGFRNPWDITFDTGFNWLGTDNDQVEGDRVFTPFYGAHFGWNHTWSSHWRDDEHLPTAPVSGPIFEGSGTGVVFGDSPQFPAKYRGVYFINDWLQKTTFVWRPQWQGALQQPAGGDWESFAVGGEALFRPTDIEVGPDGALWILGWSSGYGAEFDKGQLSNQGRVFRIAWNEAQPPPARSKASKSLDQWTARELIEDFNGPLPVWRIDVQDELVRRGAAVKQDLFAALESGDLNQAEETWTAWALGRMLPDDEEIARHFEKTLAANSKNNLNLQIQALRILAFRIREFGRVKSLPAVAVALLESDEPRLRCATVQAIVQARQQIAAADLAVLLAEETDRVTFYCGWQGLRELVSPDELKRLLQDERGGVRRGALLALLETNSLNRDEIAPLASDRDLGARDVALSRLGLGIAKPRAKVQGRTVPIVDAETPALVRNMKVKSQSKYVVVPGGLQVGQLNFTDREYLLKNVPPALVGADFIRTSNSDDGSRGERFLTFDAVVPVRVYVAIDSRVTPTPKWVCENFQASELQIEADHWTYQLFSREFPPGPVALGGNTNDGKSGGKSHYLILIEMLPLQQQPKATTLDAALTALGQGDAERGEILFKNEKGAGCIKCHSLDKRKNAFGPLLGGIGLRADARHIMQSIVEPSAVITEGFSLQVVQTDDGKTHSGVLLEESSLTLKLGLADGKVQLLDKQKIETRTSSKQSAMPVVALVLSPEQVADIAAFLLTQKAPIIPADKSNELERPVASSGLEPISPKTVVSVDGFGYQLEEDQLQIKYAGNPVADYVFKDEKIRRPFFANVCAPDGTKLTRNHPPESGKDSSDHDTMHPGLWLGFGDISGNDFWRNQGRVEHLRFAEEPAAKNDTFAFVTESRLLGSDDKEVCRVVSRYRLFKRPVGWLLIWDATFHSDEREFAFGDQEEMGFGARVATQITEQNGGLIVTSNGLKTAKESWGKPAQWTDYSGTLEGQPSGITLMASPHNFRPSWWHNRDYGAFVSNPFGRAAMGQGSKSNIVVSRGDAFRIVFSAGLHRGEEYEPAKEYQFFCEQLR